MYVIDGRTAQVSIRVLGDCHVSSSGRLITPPFSFLRILTFLLLEGHGKPVMRRRVGGLIWSDYGSEQASADIRQAVARIRRFQEDHHFQLLSADANMVWLNLDQNIYFDLAEFVDHIENPSPKAWLRLCEIYNGDLLESVRTAGEGFEEWLGYQRSALRYKFIGALSQAVLLDSGLNSHDRHLCASHLLQVDPYHEGAHRALLYDAASKGQFSLVRQLFEESSRRFRSELGVEHEEETVMLYRRLISRPTVA